MADFSINPRGTPAVSGSASFGSVATTSKGAQLANLLGVAGNAAASYGNAKANEAKKKEIEKSAAAGAADAATGQVDQKRLAEELAYSKSANEVEAERQSLSFLAAYQKKYQDSIDKGIPSSELIADFDKSAKETLGHYLSDPDAAPVVAKRLTGALSSLVSSHGKAQDEERAAGAVATVGAAVLQEIKDTKTVNYTEHFDRLSGIIGKTEAKRYLTGAIANAVADTGDPSILDRAFPAEIVLKDGTRIPGPANDPATAEVISRAREQATVLKTKREAAAIQGAKGDLEVSYVDRINRGQYLTRDELRKAQESGLLTEPERVSWYSRSESERISEQEKVDAQRVVATTGTPLYLLDLKTKDRDALVTQYVDQETASNGGDPIRAAIKVAETHGFPDPRIVSALNNVPAQAAGPFAKAAETYRQIPPNLRGTFVTSTDRQITFDQFNGLVAGGATPEAAAQEVASFDPKKAQFNRAKHARDTYKALKNIGSQTVAEGSILSLTGSLSVSDLANSAATQARIAQRVGLLVDRDVPPDEALKQATRDVIGSGAVVRLGNGRSLLLQRPEGAPPVPSDFNKALQSFYQKLPEAGLKLPEGTDIKDVRLSYSPVGDSTRLILLDKYGHPLSAQSFSESEIYRDWQVKNHDELTAFNARSKSRGAFVESLKTLGIGRTPAEKIAELDKALDSRFTYYGIRSKQEEAAMRAERDALATTLTPP